MNILTEIDKFIKALSANPYISFIGFLIGIISLIYAFYIARRDRKVKWLRYFTGSSNLIENGKSLYPRLDVTYDGRKLDNFSITKLSIKNKGTEIIRPDDIVINDPIRVSVNESQNVELLEYTIIKTTDKNSNFSLNSVDKNSFTISFDFIEPEDSTTIQILHTGKDSQDITVSGTVIGAKKPFAAKDTSDSIAFQSIVSRLTKGMFYFLARTPAKIFGIFTALLGGLLFIGLTRYFFLKSSMILTVLCALPSAFFIFLFVVSIFRQTDPERESIVNETISNILIKSMPTDEQEIDT